MHAVVALLYPFSWQHTFIPVLPGSMLDIVCCPTPFLVGLLSSSLPKLKELPVEEVRASGRSQKRRRLTSALVKEEKSSVQFELMIN